MQASTHASTSKSASSVTVNGSSHAAATKSSSSIDPELFRRIQPHEYLSRFLAEGYRPDGRSVGNYEARQPAINVGSISSADGSALVKLGETTVLCGIRAEIAEPDLSSPRTGFLVPNVDLPPMCSSKFRPGPPSDEAQVLSNRLRSIALSSGMLPLSSLCIQPSRAVWVIYADLLCVNYDGNIADASLLALVAALKNTRIPKARWDEDTEQAVALADDEGDLIGLDVRSTVLSASFGLAETGEILSDLTAFEEPLCQTRVTVALDERGSLKHVYQAGPGLRDPKNPAGLLVQCIKLARERWKQLNAVL